MGRRSNAIYKTNRWRSLRLKVLNRDGHRCQACGKAGWLEVDHRQPIARGGDPWDMANLQALCRHCHSRKTYGENHKPDPVRDRWRELVDEVT